MFFSAFNIFWDLKENEIFKRFCRFVSNLLMLLLNVIKITSTHKMADKDSAEGRGPLQGLKIGIGYTF